MDAEQDEGITSSGEQEESNTVEPEMEGYSSPVQQSPDQSDYNENYRSPEAVDSLPGNELDTQSSEVEKGGDIEQDNNEPVDDENEELHDDNKEISNSEDIESESNPCDTVENININESEGNNGLADTSADINNGTSIDEQDVSNVSQSNVSPHDTSTLDEAMCESEQINENSYSPLNAVSSTSKGENIENFESKHESVDNSLDDVSDEDSNDFNSSNKLDDVSDENSDDFDNVNDVSQSETCTSSHNNSRLEEEVINSSSENNSIPNSSVYVQSCDSHSAKDSDFQRTSTEELPSGSADTNISNLNKIAQESFDYKLEENSNAVSSNNSREEHISTKVESDTEESNAVHGELGTAEIEHEEEQSMEVFHHCHL